MSSALLVFPNPASGDVTVSFDYGSEGTQSRSLTVYDITGRKMAQEVPGTQKGSWVLKTEQWAAGLYIIRMEEKGSTLQTQRVVITH